MQFFSAYVAIEAFMNSPREKPGQMPLRYIEEAGNAAKANLLIQIIPNIMLRLIYNLIAAALRH